MVDNEEIHSTIFDCRSIDALGFDCDINELASGGLGVIHFNVRSCNANFDLFIAYLKSLNYRFGVIVLTEIFVTETTDNFHLERYQSYNLYRDSRGTGIKTLVLKSIQYVDSHTSCNLRRMKGMLSMLRWVPHTNSGQN